MPDTTNQPIVTITASGNGDPLNSPGSAFQQTLTPDQFRQYVADFRQAMQHSREQLLGLVNALHQHGAQTTSVLNGLKAELSALGVDPLANATAWGITPEGQQLASQWRDLWTKAIVPAVQQMAQAYSPQLSGHLQQTGQILDAMERKNMESFDKILKQLA